MGALFNDINRRVTMMRKRRIAHSPFKRLIELLVITGVFATVCFVLPVLWSTCTPLPTGSHLLIYPSRHTRLQNYTNYTSTY